MSEERVPEPDVQGALVEPFRVRLRRLREARHLIPSYLGLLVGITEGAIRQMESGQTQNASFPVGLRLAAVLGVEPGYLAFGDSDGTDEPRVRNRPGVIPLPPGRIDAVETQVTRIMSLFEALERRVSGIETRVAHVGKRRN